MSRARDVSSHGGLTQVVPTSVAVGSGSGSVGANGTVTFSGASSISLNGCFNSTYDNYRIVTSNMTNTGGANNILMRMRSTSDDAGANYSWSFQQISSLSANSTAAGSNDTSVYLIRINEGGISSAEFTLMAPFLSQKTNSTYLSVYHPFSTDTRQYTGSFTHQLANSYQGFSLIMTGGTLAGNIRIYGYNNG